MNNLFIMREIARWDRSVWILFSLLNKEMNRYFNVLRYEYEMCFRVKKIDEYKTCYKLDEKRHRTDGPAVVWYNGDKSWWLNGKRHRLDGPAIIHNDGSEEWYANGNFHRLDGPAVIWLNHNCYWYKNGRLHRLDGPAIEYVNEADKKFNQWYIDGKLIMK